jgi:hypothetical protein
MCEIKKPGRSKGGRPAKAIKRNQILSLKCSHLERIKIIANARKTQLTVSEYLREMGLHGQLLIREIYIPKEVLQLTGTLNHMAANLNQLAKKSNRVTEQWTKTDEQNLEELSAHVKLTATTILNLLQ